MKKFTGKEFIHPLKMEVYPWETAWKSPLIVNVDKGVLEQDKVQLKKNDSTKSEFKKKMIFGFKGLYNLSLLSTHPLVFLLLKSKSIMDTAGFLMRGDKESIKLLFDGQNKTQQVISDALEMYERGDIEGAINKVEDFDNQLELMGMNTCRIELLKLSSQFKTQNKLYLSAAIDLITAATLSDSSDTLETAEHDQVSAKGKMYCSAILLFRAYIRENGFNEDLRSCIKTFSSKAGFFLKKESQYRGQAGIHAKGSVDLKFIKIPKLVFGKDSSSKEINEVIANNLQKLADEINHIYDPKSAIEWIKKGRYRDLQSDMAVLDFLETVEKTFGDPKILDSMEEQIESMYHWLQSGAGEECRPQVILSHCRFLCSRDKNVEALAMLLDIAHKDLNPIVLAQIDKIRQRLEKSEQQELAQMLLECYDLPEDIKEYFESSTGLNPEKRFRNPLLNIFYSNRNDLVLEGVRALHDESFFVQCEGDLYEVSYEEMKTLVKARLSYNSELKKAPEVKKIVEQDLEHVGYREFLRKEEVKAIQCSKRDSFGAKIVQICEALGDYKVFSNIKKRALEERVNIGVFGLISSGKSTFVNALIGKEMLGVDAEISTNVLTTIVQSPEECAEIIFDNGDKAQVALEEVPEYSTEQKNPGNEKGVAEIRIYDRIKAPYGITDVPGIGSFKEAHQDHEKMIQRQMNITDCLVLVTTPDLGIKDFEMGLLKTSVEEKKIPTLVVLNKCEGFDEDELEDVEDALRSKIRKSGISDSNLDILCTSAKLALYSELGREKRAEEEGYTLEECEEISKLTKLRVYLMDSVYSEVKEAKQKSLVSRLIYEIQLMQNELELEKTHCFLSMRGQRESLRNELDELEKLFHFISRPSKFEEQVGAVLERYDFIDAMALLHDLDLKALKAGIFEQSNETYYRVKEAVEDAYIKLREEKVDGAQAHLSRRIINDLTTIQNFLEKTASKEELEDIKVYDATVKQQALLDKLFNKTKYIQDVGKKVVADLVTRDRLAAGRELNGHLTEYEYFYSYLEDRKTRLERTLNLDQKEAEVRLEVIAQEISELKNVINKINEVFDEGKFSKAA